MNNKNFVKKILLISLIVMLFSTISVYAIPSDIPLNRNVVYIDENGLIDFSGIEMELIESEGGIYEAEVLIQSKNTNLSSPQAQAVMTWSIQRDANYDNLYDIYYTITANTLINGVVGDIKVSNTSILFPEVYFEKEGYVRSFTATTLYSGSAGRMVAPK